MLGYGVLGLQDPGDSKEGSVRSQAPGAIHPQMASESVLGNSQEA